MTEEEKQETTESNWWLEKPPSESSATTGQGSMTETLSLEEDSITALGESWLTAKAAVLDAQIHLDKIAADLIKEVGIRREGSQTFYVGDHKITTTQNINYSVNQGMAQSLLENGVLNPELFESVFLPKVSLSKTAYKETIALMPELSPAIQACLTSKAGKPVVKVERHQKED